MKPPPPCGLASSHPPGGLVLDMTMAPGESPGPSVDRTSELDPLTTQMS